MADRYWVGGTGTWGNSQTTNWSATSGGTAGASVPTASDNVYSVRAGWNDDVGWYKHWIDSIRQS